MIMVMIVSISCFIILIFVIYSYNTIIINYVHIHQRRRICTYHLALELLFSYYQMLYFIRHAQSIYNSAQRQIEHQVGQKYLDHELYLSAKFDRKYMDVEITQKGIEQAKQARQKVKDIEVDLILVSPLRRALHTCSIVFENHQSKAQIIVEPAFREIMESSNDIGSEISESIAKYPFSFQKIKDPDAWYIETLTQKDREEIYSKLQGLKGQERKEKAIEQSLRVEKENWFQRRKQPQRQEELKLRILPCYQQQKKVIQHYLQNYKRIAIVAHSECIKRYAGYKISNCQVFQFQATKL